VEAAGGIAVLLPPQGEDAAGVVERLDGLIISGGSDVEPTRYGADHHPADAAPRPERDAWELGLLDRAAPRHPGARHLPRAAGDGRARGGTLSSTCPTSSATTSTPRVATPSAGCRWPPPSARPCASLVGPELQVSCHHHQSVSSHPGLVATAHAADGTVEALEDPERPFWLGSSGTPSTGTTTACSAASPERRSATERSSRPSTATRPGPSTHGAGGDRPCRRCAPVRGPLVRVSKRTVTRPSPEPQTQPARARRARRPRRGASPVGAARAPPGDGTAVPARRAPPRVGGPRREQVLLQHVGEPGDADAQQPHAVGDVHARPAAPPPPRR
jgi:putative glutamine amidotransferase